MTSLFNEALERPASERAAFLDAACAGDAALRAEVESLLASHDESGSFLDVPAAVAAGLASGEASLAPGQALGAYRVVREIARGGMGVVYLAEDTRLGRQVALKVLPPTLLRDEGRRERLRLEARAAASLSHPGIATVYALEDIDDHVCLVSEYVRGGSLRSELARGPLPLPALLRTGIEIAQALAAAHAAGVIHRDLKPENVVRDERGRVKLVDFGIARFDAPAGAPLQRRLTEAGMVLGTPAYMSPEQLDGAEVDSRTDIFSLGVLLFELATARNPFESTTPVSSAARVLAAEPPALSEVNPALPWELDWILRGCLKKKRGERYQSAGEVARDLEQLLLGRFVPGGAVGAFGPDLAGARRWWDLHQASAIGVSVLMVVLVGIVHEWVRNDLSLSAFLGVIAAAAINWVLRLHLLFTRYFNRREMAAQLRRTEWWLRGSDLTFAVILFAAAVLPAREHPIFSAFLAAVALGWSVTSSVVEPATRRAAFPD
ncbi:MAG: serine/threonine protein kinase [Acidobacteria bacterium]|nr:MAG: serine/threonine protein kinase [Acidobacteriota bacterium]